MPHISVVTPVYRAEGCLEELYRRLDRISDDILAVADRIMYVLVKES